MISPQLPELEDPSILRAEALERLIYIVGAPRGGTTIMQQCLGLHDRILSLPMLTHFANHVWRYRKTVHDRLLRGIFRLPSWYRERKILHNLPSPAREQLTSYVGSVWAEKNLGRLYALYALIWALDEGNKKDPASIVCWADKANDVKSLEEIRAAMPNARFLFLIRDPRGSVASMMRQAGGEAGTDQLTARNLRPLVESAIYWRNLCQASLYFAGRHPSVSMVVRFEDLLADPVPVLNEIYRFCAGEGIPADVLQERLASLEYWTSNEPDERGHGIDRRAQDRWRTTLSAAEAEAIAGLTWRTARRLGYDIAPPGRSSGAFASLARLGPSIRTALAVAKHVFLEGRERLIRAPPGG